VSAALFRHALQFFQLGLGGWYSTHTGVFPACDRVTRIDIVAVGLGCGERDASGVLAWGNEPQQQESGQRQLSRQQRKCAKKQICPQITFTVPCDSCGPPMAQNMNAGV
jgi:hypothetical protein